jgi:hypothetical protein
MSVQTLLLRIAFEILQADTKPERRILNVSTSKVKLTLNSPFIAWVIRRYSQRFVIALPAPYPLKSSCNSLSMLYYYSDASSL